LIIIEGTTEGEVIPTGRVNTFGSNDTFRVKVNLSLCVNITSRRRIGGMEVKFQTF